MFVIKKNSFTTTLSPMCMGPYSKSNKTSWNTKKWEETLKTGREYGRDKAGNA